MGLVAMRASGQSGLGHLAAKRTWPSVQHLQIRSQEDQVSTTLLQSNVIV